MPEINGNFMSSSAAQMQARLEAAQSERILTAVGQNASKAQNAVQGAKSPADKAAAVQKLTKVAQDFESIFIGYLLKTMRETVPKSGFMGESRDQEIFGSMRDDEMAKAMSKAGGIGLSKLMMDQMKKQL